METSKAYIVKWNVLNENHLFYRSDWTIMEGVTLKTQPEAVMTQSSDTKRTIQKSFRRALTKFYSFLRFTWLWERVLSVQALSHLLNMGVTTSFRQTKGQTESKTTSSFCSSNDCELKTFREAVLAETRINFPLALARVNLIINCLGGKHYKMCHLELHKMKKTLHLKSWECYIWFNMFLCFSSKLYLFEH